MNKTLERCPLSSADVFAVKLKPVQEIFYFLVDFLLVDFFVHRQELPVERDQLVFDCQRIYRCSSLTPSYEPRSTKIRLESIFL